MFALQEVRSAPEPIFQPQEEEGLRFCPGILVEIAGPDARAQAARLLESYPLCPAAWIEQSLEPFPDEVRRFRLNFDKVLFIDGKKDSSWALSACVRSGDFPVVVYYAPYGPDKELRRLKRMARASGTMVLLLREETRPAWQIHSQYSTHKGRLELVRGRRS
jgi:hypothetical protein